MEEGDCNGLLYRWTTDFVGSSTAFSINFVLIVIGGICYTFGLVRSPFILFIFGVAVPILLAICFYNYLYNSKIPLDDSGLTKYLRVKKWNVLLICVDCFIIVTFAALIHYDILNYLIFRFLQTLFFPIALLVGFRGFFAMTNEE